MTAPEPIPAPVPDPVGAVLLAGVPVPVLTPRLGLAKPFDDDANWGTAFRDTMDRLDGFAGRTFVQPTQPTVPGPWVWVQTGLGPNGTDVTVWVEDGLPG